jgi:transcriptional regulator with XRE-family HTH domain
MPRVSASQDKDQSLVRVGSAIKGRRKHLAMSQEALAAASGVDRAHMGKIERGERNVTLLNLVRIAGALHCTLSSLLIDAEL